MSRINTNVSSLVAQKTLARSNATLQTSLNRLSTGLRINSGKDDPAGLIASENLRRDITSAEKAISNSERANQLIATADSALGQISGLLNDIRGLVTEAANSGVLSEDQIAANQLQVDSSLEAIDRIAQVTTFQGRKLLDGSLDFVTNTTTGGSSIVNLNIDQANLGTAASLGVSVDITQAASKATITNNGGVNFTAGTKSAGTITFADVTTPAVQASATVSLSGSSGSLSIAAVSGGAAAGAVGNGTDFTFARAAGAQIATGTVALTGSAGSITVGAVAGTASDGTVGNTTSIVTQRASGAAVATGSLSLTNTTGSFTVTAVAGTSADGAQGNTASIVIGTSGAATSASYNSGTNTITVNVNNGGAATVTDISNAIGGLAEFNTSGVTNGSNVFNASDAATYNSVLSGGANGTTAATYNSGTNTITASVAVGATVTQVASAIDGLAAFTASAATGGANAYAASDNNTYSSQLSGGLNGTTSATYDSNTNVVTVNVAAGATVAQVGTAIDGLADFSVSANTGGTNRFDGADYGTQSNALGSGGANAVSNDDVITITANDNGAAFNGTLTFVESGSVASGGVDVAVSGANITVSVNNNSTYDLEDLADAIQGELSGYTVSLSSTAGDGTFTSSTQSATTANLSGGVNDTGTGIGADLVLKVAGLGGSEVFNFQSGTGLKDIVSAINLVSDATGVSAKITSGNLELNSTTYGSSGFVDAEVISEGSGGTFKQNLTTNRASGSDIVASVNGVAANGKGNTLSINTATLDLSLTVSDGSSTDINLSINGGGAVFQLGPDVVSNQQARIGIGSVNTAKLGGSSGRLYELRSGNNKDLSSDATAAAAVVDQAIDSVTSLRGRLGAFQRTTLETNIASLNDTITNLTEAESSIRDADFASETAKLTRAQILVQSGTSVLQIANQNPQNVLSLLRG